eukprot:gene5731-5669_t
MGLRIMPHLLYASAIVNAREASGEKRITCGGSYGWFSEKPWENTPCPPPTWRVAWELNMSTTPDTPWGPEIAAGNIPGYFDPTAASRWGWITFDWSDANAVWQDEHPHNNEAVLVEQCRRVKALGTGTRCMVYRNTELALQWQETSRRAMTQANADAGWFLQFKTQEACDAAPPCNVAAWHNIINASAPLIPCNKTAPSHRWLLVATSCRHVGSQVFSANGQACAHSQISSELSIVLQFHYSKPLSCSPMLPHAHPATCPPLSFPHPRVYNEPVGGPWPPNPASNNTRFGDNGLGDGQLFWDFRNPA